MRRTKRESVLAGKWIYIIVGILAIVLLVLILGKTLGGSDDSGKDKKTSLSTEEEDVIDRVREELREGVTPELDELIQQYYTAMSSCDISTLEQIVSSVSDEEKDIIRRKKDYIEAYNNVGVYARVCPDKKSYLVFTEYDIKFKNEDTMVPGLETFYVKKTDAGSLCIYKGSEMDADVEQFITEQLKGQDVQALINEVNENYIEALVSSETLLKFVKGFGGDMTLIEEAETRVAEQKAQTSSGAAATAQKTSAPKETQAAGSTAAPKQTQAAGSTAAPKQTQVAGSTATPKQTQAAGSTATPKPAQASATNEEVLIVASVNLRKGNDEKSERITTMIVGDKATRVSITDNGWSKVKYNGTEGYVKSDYVTTYKITGDKVKTTATINVRLEASENANMAGQIPIDTTITRHASCSNGWSQIEFDGSIGYVKTQYLTK